MAWTQTDLDRIEAAIASGELRVGFEGRNIEYRSIEELRKARAEIKAELAQSGTPIVRQIRISSTKGF